MNNQLQSVSEQRTVLSTEALVVLLKDMKPKHANLYMNDGAEAPLSRNQRIGQEIRETDLQLRANE